MINFRKYFRRFWRQLRGGAHTPTPPVVTPDPPIVEPVPSVPTPPAPVPVRRPTREEVLTYRGHLANLRDSADRVIWTPSLQALPSDLRTEWLHVYVAAGGTHIPVGPFEAGEIYPGAGFFNPDWEENPTAIRTFLDEIRNTRTVRGHGLIPVIFVDGGGDEPESRLKRTMPTIAEAIRGIENSVVVLPTGWEPHAWRARQQWDAIQLWLSIMRGREMPVLAWHGWPGRSNGASNDPFNADNDDVWLDDPVMIRVGDNADGTPIMRQGRFGSGVKFWRTTPFDMFLYQIEPPRTMSEANCGTIGSPGTGVYPEGCWLDNFLHALCRIGGVGTVDATGAISGGPWTTKRFVLFETTTYWEFRKKCEPGVTQRVNDRAFELANQYGVSLGFGTGLPMAYQK